MMDMDMQLHSESSAVGVMTAEQSPEARMAPYLDIVANKSSFPVFASQIVDTMALLENEDISLRKLGEVVTANYGLTLKVLQVANAFGNNPNGIPIFDVHLAIFRLGVERVRAMASGMVYFEHFRGQSDAVKDLVLLSLVSANQSELAAEALKSTNVEEAYLSGMLRNLGEVLIASYFPDDYGRIRTKEAAPNVTPAVASRRVLGFTYDEFGLAAARRWKLPPQVTEPMVSDEITKNTPELVKVANFSQALTAAVYRSSAADARPRITALLQKYGDGLSLSKDQIEKLATAALNEARKTLTPLKLSTKELSVIDKNRISLAFGKMPAAARRSPTGAAGTPAMAMNPRVFAQLEREVDDLMRAVRGPSDPQTILLTVLEAIHRGAGFDRALFALVSQERDMLQGRLAIGAGAEDLKARFTIVLGPQGGPIGAALARGKEVTIRSDWDLKPEEEIQLTQLGAKMLCVLPMSAKGQLIGCLYYDQTETVGNTTSVVDAALHRLRDRTVQVLSKKG